MGTIFWDAKGYILVDFLPRKGTVHAVHYFQMLQKQRHALCDKIPLKRHTILEHNNACPHIAHLTAGKTEKVWMESDPPSSHGCNILKQTSTTAEHSSTCSAGRNAWIVLRISWNSDGTSPVTQGSICFCIHTFVLL
jgi:hypothetical protein